MSTMRPHSQTIFKIGDQAFLTGGRCADGTVIVTITVKADAEYDETGRCPRIGLQLYGPAVEMRRLRDAINDGLSLKPREGS